MTDSHYELSIHKVVHYVSGLDLNTPREDETHGSQGVEDISGRMYNI